MLILQHLDKKAHDLVRLALFSEQERIPLRCKDINKKGKLPPHLPHPILLRTLLVLSSHPHSFNTVLQKARLLLRKMFAVELVELQARNYRDQDPAGDFENATGVKKKGRPDYPSTPQPLRQAPRRTSSARFWT